VFTWDGGRPVLIMVARGMREFLDVLGDVAPRVPCRIGWQGRWMERFGWRRSWFEDLGEGHAG